MSYYSTVELIRIIGSNPFVAWVRKCEECGGRLVLRRDVEVRYMEHTKDVNGKWVWVSHRDNKRGRKRVFEKCYLKQCAACGERTEDAWCMIRNAEVADHYRATPDGDGYEF